RPLGGPVRRRRQRRPDRRRPVPRLRAREVGRNLALDAPPAARLRRERPGALERPARALPPERRAGEPENREPDDERAVLPPAAPAGPRSEGTAARRDDAEGLAAAEGRILDAPRARRRFLPRRDRRPVRRPRAHGPAHPLLRKDLLRHL